MFGAFFELNIFVLLPKIDISIKKIRPGHKKALKMGKLIGQFQQKFVNL